MKKGDHVELKAKKTLRIGDSLNENKYAGKILWYQEKEESLYITLDDCEVEELSLDNIYECRIKSKDCYMDCTGRIKDRYIGEEGPTIRLWIENGFYKISIKSVDKQIV